MEQPGDWVRKGQHIFVEDTPSKVRSRNTWLECVGGRKNLN